MTLLLRGQGVRGSSYDHFFYQKLPKKMIHKLDKFGGLRKAVFRQFKFQTYGGGTVPPPLAGEPLTTYF